MALSLDKWRNNWAQLPPSETAVPPFLTLNNKSFSPRSKLPRENVRNSTSWLTHQSPCGLIQLSRHGNVSKCLEGSEVNVLAHIPPFSGANYCFSSLLLFLFYFQRLRLRLEWNSISHCELWRELMIIENNYFSHRAVNIHIICTVSSDMWKSSNLLVTLG